MLRGLVGTLGLWAAGAVVLRAVAVPPEICPPITAADARGAAAEAAAWIDRTQRPDGSYLYEYDIEAGREVPGYNVVRHAGVTMSLYQLAAYGDASGMAAADRGLAWMQSHLYAHDDWVALQDPADGSIDLGASALMLAALDQRRLATGDGQYDGLMRQLARFHLEMQQDDGSFLLTWRPDTGAPDPRYRSKYATGEAFWALAIMHSLFPGEGWDQPVRSVARYLSLFRDEVENQKFPPWADQWAAYGLAEMRTWPIDDDNARYARSLAERFGFLVRIDSRRTGGEVSDLLRGPQARGAGLGTWVEALDSLWLLASADARLAPGREKIADRAICSAGLLLERQVTPQESLEYREPGIARGAWFTDGITRMDDQQHALSGLIAAVPILLEREARSR